MTIREMICPFYLIVDRDFIVDTLLNNKKSIYNFNEEDKRIAEIETECKVFYSYNKHISIWKISFYENNSLAYVNPITEVNSRL